MPQKKKKKLHVETKTRAVRYKTKNKQAKPTREAGPRAAVMETKPGLSPHFLPPQTPGDVPSLEGTQDSLSGDVGPQRQSPHEHVSQAPQNPLKTKEGSSAHKTSRG